MSFTFKTEALGGEMEVEGEFVTHENFLTGKEYQYFELLSLKHKGEELNPEGLDEDTHDSIADEALRQAGEEAMKAEEESVVEKFYY